MDSKTLRVFRYKRGDGDGERFDVFEVPVERGTTVLDALLWVRQHSDPGLALRHSCLHASCGTCGVQVDGREVLACVEPIGEHAREHTIEPLANLPVLADLVVDMHEYYARLPDDHPLVRAAEPDGVERYEDCIDCGLCLSACPVAAASDSYVGPAALAAAQRLLEEPRGADRDAVLDWASGPGGAWSCHVGYECTEVCPSGVGPAERIMALRRALLFGPDGEVRR